MTDTFLLVDAVLWSLAVALAVLAVWLALPRARTWDVAAFFEAALGAMRGRSPDAPDAQAILGPSCTWPAIGAWSPEVQETVRRRLARARVVWVASEAMDVPLVESYRIPATADGIDSLPGDADLRWLVAGRSTDVLRLLHQFGGFRDHARMVLLAGVDLTADAEWLRESFTQDAFDLELARTVPFCTLRTGPGQLLRAAAPSRTGREAVRVFDFGEADLADPAVGRALAVTFAAVVAG